MSSQPTQIPPSDFITVVNDTLSLPCDNDVAKRRQACLLFLSRIRQVIDEKISTSVENKNIANNF